MLVPVCKVQRDGVLLGRSCMMVPVRKILHDGVCQDGPA